MNAKSNLFSATPQIPDQARNALSSSFSSRLSKNIINYNPSMPNSNNLNQRYGDGRTSAALTSAGRGLGPDSLMNKTIVESKVLFLQQQQQSSNNPNIQPQFYRSVSSSMAMGECQVEGDVAPLMLSSKIKLEKLQAQHQRQNVKLQQFKSSVSTASANLGGGGPYQDAEKGNQLSLGDTLRQNRVIREHIERERAELQSRTGGGFGGASSEGSSFRIARPATPKLNLLKMKNQLPLQPKQSVQGAPGIGLRKKAFAGPVQLQPLERMPQLPSLNQEIPENKKVAKRKARRRRPIEETQQSAIDEELNKVLNADLHESAESQIRKYKIDEDDDYNQRDERNYEEEDIDFYGQQQSGNEEQDEDDQEFQEEEEDLGSQAVCGLISNFQEKFEEILEKEDVSDAIELNEMFLAEHLGVRPEELSRLTKIELRVDTSCHNLQVTGEILCSLESLRMNDSILQSFRDLGTSFRFVRILHLSRCQLKEVQGIQAFLNLEELYISHNEIDDLFDLSFLDHLAILDLEGNNVLQLEQLHHLRRCIKLENLCLKDNPVAANQRYVKKVEEVLPGLQYLDDQVFQIYIQEKKNQKPQWDAAAGFMSEMIQRLLRLCDDKSWTPRGRVEDLLKQIDDDQDDNQILLIALKNQTLEQKAQRVSVDRTLIFGDSPSKQRPQSSTHKRNPMILSSKQGGDQFSNTTSTLFKEAKTRISTSMTATTGDHLYGPTVKKENNGVLSNQESDSLSKTSSVIKIQRSKIKLISKKEEDQGVMPDDISNLIQGLQILNNREGIRDKLVRKSVLGSGSIRSKKDQSVTEINEVPNQPDIKGEQHSQLNFQKASNVDSDMKGKKGDFNISVLRKSIGVSDGFKKGPIKASDRIVLRASEIQFSSSLKERAEREGGNAEK